MGVAKRPIKAKSAIKARNRSAPKPDVKSLLRGPMGKSNRSRRSSSICIPAPHSPYTRVDVLIVVFAESDSYKQDTEIQEVKSAFESFNYNVETILITVENAWLYLKKKLRNFFYAVNKDTLQIIYYTGHGSGQPGKDDRSSDQLYLCR
jgi:hypothetical protein